MKLLSYRRQGVPGIGALIGSSILDFREAAKNNVGGAFTDIPMDGVSGMISFLGLGEDGLGEARRAVEWVADRVGKGESVKGLVSLDEVEIEAPIPRPRKNVVCLGLNYADHVAEGSKTLDEEQPLPEHPIFFTKPPTAINGPYDDIVYPRVTERLDYEVELAVVIGKEGKYIAEEDAYDHIAGYSVFNDVSARDLQTRHGQWYKGKSLDGFAPMGPYLVTPDEVGDPMDLDVSLSVNGVIRQDSNTSNLIFDIPRIVSTLSAGITLDVGDIIATGTPSGVGSAHELGLLKVGDLVEARIEKIGSLRNRVVSED
ncbi:MAG: fumarylacetoacetate hydrolase family protein [Candidatus Bathyarchaeota archaeon]|nr:fumarylacetoacetate hydrolase family protein [Candidatus Bathyarchaeota archaeon]